MEWNILEIMVKGWVGTVPILICSILTLTFAIERFLHYRKVKVDLNAFIPQVREMIMEGQIMDAINLCEKTPGPVSAVVKEGLLVHDRSMNDVARALGNAQALEDHELNAHIGLVGSIASTAPYLGLFGTVVGMMSAFRAISLSGLGNPSVVAGGIGEALINTAFGLLVAIIATWVYNWLNSFVANFNVEMTSAGSELISALSLKASQLRAGK